MGAQVGAADADGDDRDHQAEQCDPGGDEEGTVETGRQRLLVSGLPRGRSGGGVGAGTVGDHRPGHGAQHRQADGSAYLPADVEQAGRYP
jgi:hypothetical protein